MIAIVHIGFHRTGSTYAQFLAAYNSKRLLERGVYFKPNLYYPAHHDEAVCALNHDMRKLGRMVADARDVGAETVLISSENLESIIFRPEVGRGIVETLRLAGCERVVFALYVRNQEQTFWSLYAQLSLHVPVDAQSMFREVMNRGRYVIAPSQGAEARLRKWSFSFDHEKNVSEFHQRLGGPERSDVSIRVYDFDRFERFPGEDLFAELCVTDAITRFPHAVAQNTRLPDATVRFNYRRRFGAGLRRLSAARVPKFLTLDAEGEAAHRRHMSDLLRERFAGGNQRLLEIYGCQRPLGGALQDDDSSGAEPERTSTGKLA